MSIQPTHYKQGLAKVGDTYLYCFRIRGKQYKGSTRAYDLPTAKKELVKLRQQALDGTLGVKENPKHNPTLATLHAEWVKAYRAVHSPKHLRDVESALRLWLIPALGRKRIDSITTHDVLMLRNSMLEAGQSQTSVNDRLKIFKLLSRFAVKQGWIDALPFRVEFLRVQQKPRVTLPASRAAEFLKAIDATAKNPHVHGAIRAMFGLGLREAEALGMRWEWLNLDDQTYTVGKAKGKEARVLPVPDWLMADLKRLAGSRISEWIFPAEDGKPHRSQFCKKALKRVCEKLGLGKLTQHRLRATFATLHSDVGTPLADIQGMLGHKDIQTTMIYIEGNLEARRKAQNALNQVLNLNTERKQA